MPQTLALCMCLTVVLKVVNWGGKTSFCIEKAPDDFILKNQPTVEVIIATVLRVLSVVV